MAYPPLIKNLIEKLQVLPSVGPKTAEQYVFALKNLSARDIEELADAIHALKELTRCQKCLAITDQSTLCEICANLARDEVLLMVVESEPDLESIEKTARYQGLYFVLGEVNEQNIQKLIQRLKVPNSKTREAILAFDVTPQMELSLFEIKQALKKAQINIKISRLGRGLPTGGDLRYADTQTLLGALQHRENV